MTYLFKLFEATSRVNTDFCTTFKSIVSNKRNGSLHKTCTYPTGFNRCQLSVHQLVSQRKQWQHCATLTFTRYQSDPGRSFANCLLFFRAITSIFVMLVRVYTRTLSSVSVILCYSLNAFCPTAGHGSPLRGL